LTEATGELLFVTVDRDTTSFLHNDLYSGKEYFYRVYVLDDDGQYHGSNIVSARVPVTELVLDGGFEQSGSLTLWTSVWDTLPALLTADESYAGQQSLYLRNEESTCNAVVSTFAIRIAEGMTYKLSFWYKASGAQLDQSSSGLILDLEQSQNLAALLFEFNVAELGGTFEDVGWTQLFEQFVASGTGVAQIELLSCATEMWFDEIHLVPVPE
jgi:hypothetical protein